MVTNLQIDIKALNQSIQPLVAAAFWSAVATAIVLPVAAAVGSVVSKKIEKKWGNDDRNLH